MDPLLSLFLGLLIGALVGALVAVVILQRRGAAHSFVDDPAVIESRHQLALAELHARETAVSSVLREELASVQATSDALRQQVQVAQQQYRELAERQRAEQEARTEQERTESKVLQALAPVRESLHDMQKKVTELRRSAACSTVS